MKNVLQKISSLTTLPCASILSKYPLLTLLGGHFLKEGYFLQINCMKRYKGDLFILKLLKFIYIILSISQTKNQSLKKYKLYLFFLFWNAGFCICFCCLCTDSTHTFTLMSYQNQMSTSQVGTPL